MSTGSLPEDFYVHEENLFVMSLVLNEQEKNNFASYHFQFKSEDEDVGGLLIIHDENKFSIEYDNQRNGESSYTDLIDKFEPGKDKLYIAVRDALDRIFPIESHSKTLQDIM